MEIVVQETDTKGRQGIVHVRVTITYEELRDLHEHLKYGSSLDFNRGVEVGFKSSGDMELFFTMVGHLPVNVRGGDVSNE